MSQATPQIRNFAKRLIAHEALGRKSSRGKIPAEFPVCVDLSRHLVTLIGGLGLRSLLSRALALACAEVPALRTVTVKADGTLEGLEAACAHLGPVKFAAAEGVLLAQLLGLLVAFIGPGVTAAMVEEIWPQFSVGEYELSFGGKNEKAI